MDAPARRRPIPKSAISSGDSGSCACVSLPWMPPLQATQIMAGGKPARVCSYTRKCPRNATLTWHVWSLSSKNDHITHSSNTSSRAARLHARSSRGTLFQHDAPPLSLGNCAPAAPVLSHSTHPAAPSPRIKHHSAGSGCRIHALLNQRQHDQIHREERSGPDQPASPGPGNPRRRASVADHGETHDGIHQREQGGVTLTTGTSRPLPRNRPRGSAG